MWIAAGRTAVLALLGATAWAQAQATGEVQRDPQELVRKAAQNEINANSGSARFMFRGVKTTPKGSTTKIYVETREGTAGMAVAYNDKPLTVQQRQDEEARTERFLKNPEELRKKRAQEREDAERTTRIVRSLPDAFLYEYVGEEQGSTGIGRAGEPLVKLKFRPNPAYRPPSRVEDVLMGMQGFVLVDAKHERLASIDATLFRDVTFGWGILGHLDRGGHFIVHQEEVGNNDWEISCMSLKFTGRILLVKSLLIESTEKFSDFKRVSPDLTFAQALEILKKEDAGGADSSSLAVGGPSR